MEQMDQREVKRVAGLELSALRAAEVLPADLFEGSRLSSAGTQIYDVNGERLFRRIPVAKGRERVGYTDMATHPAMGGPLLAVSTGLDWDEAAIRKAAQREARKRRGLTYDRTRFVAYSYPKVGVQFLKGSEEVLLLEYGTWEPVPAAGGPRRGKGQAGKGSRADYPSERKPLEPGNFERWSLLDELPAARRRARMRDQANRLKMWQSPRARRIDASIITAGRFAALLRLVDTREVHFSSRNSDHHVCYEVRGQQTNVWCVGASVQMLLDFYRYEYTQVRLAQELGLGTLANPNGLPYSRVGDVVTVIEDLTSNALDCTMITNPGWTTFRDEIRANRPLISFVPGHSRTVAGYTRNLLGLPFFTPFRGLLVYDPWPPNVGVITRWENFDTQIYQYAYRSQVTLV